MKKLKALILMSTVASLTLTLSGAAAQSDIKDANQPAVVVAVAPTYPAVARTSRAEGEVILEVKIDAQGKVTSATSVSGNEYLRKSSEVAAMRWRFASAPAGSKERSARLTFAYEFLSDLRPDDPELLISFSPPYRVEVKLNPPILH